MPWLPEAGQVAYTRQQEPLGLGHAVWCARDLVGDEPFAVLLPDDLILAETPCLKQMVDAYDEIGGNIVAVDRRAARADASATACSMSISDDGRLAKVQAAWSRSRRRKMAPSTLTHHRPLHPAARDLRPSRRSQAGRRRRDPADRRPWRKLIASGRPFHGLRFDGTPL